MDAEQMTTSAFAICSSRRSNSTAVPEHRAATSSARDRVRLATTMEEAPASQRCRAASSPILPAPSSTTDLSARSSKILRASCTAA